MSFIHHDRNNEQVLIPITVIRGGTSRAFFFEGKDVPPQGKGLEEFLLAVRGSPDPIAMDGLGGDSLLQNPTGQVRHTQGGLQITHVLGGTRRRARPAYMDRSGRLADRR